MKRTKKSVVIAAESNSDGDDDDLYHDADLEESSDDASDVGEISNEEVSRVL